MEPLKFLLFFLAAAIHPEQFRRNTNEITLRNRLENIQILIYWDYFSQNIGEKKKKVQWLKFSGNYGFVDWVIY